MHDKAEHSNIKLVSNIMLKSKYEKDRLRYLPADVLPDYYVDTRAQGSLTPAQKDQFHKRMFYAERILDQ